VFTNLLNGARFHLTPTMHGPVDIEQIAHSLGNICRFTGAGKFYSVAEHSYWMSMLVSEEHAYEALMHDAHEFVMGDINRIIKNCIPEIEAFEHKVAAYIRPILGLRPSLSAEVLEMDDRLAVTEAIFLGLDTRSSIHDWSNHMPVAFEPLLLGPEKATELFQRRYLQIGLPEEYGI